MNAYKYPAIVIGGGINGLGVIRNLGKKGIDVYCVTEKKNEAIYSKYCKKYFINPKVEHDLHELNRVLIRIKNEIGNIGVLFPTNDCSLLNASILNGNLHNPYQFIADKNTLRILIEKRKFYRSLKKNRIPFPKTLFPTQCKEGKSIVGKIQFPVIIKPSMSQIFFEYFDKKGFIVNSYEELNKYLQLTNKYDIDVFVQEIIPGPITNHYFIDGYFDRKSKPLILFARQRLRMWPLPLGNSTICKSIPISKVDDLKKTIVKYLSNINYHGIFSAEFKRDSRDNIGKLLEINARSWWYNHFPTFCGINIIFMAYLDAINKKITTQKNYQIGKKMVYSIDDLKWFVHRIFEGKLSFKEWYSLLYGKRDWVLFNGEDIRPFIMKILQMTVLTMTHPRKLIKTMNSNNLKYKIFSQ